jgi:hypothetical protein
VSRKAPERTCIGCRETTAADQLVRIVASPEGELVVDLRGRLPGRGAWVHTRAACLERGVKALPRALAGRGPIPAVDATVLPQRVRDAVNHAVAEALSIAAAGGGLARGRSALLQAVQEGRSSILLLASDAAERTVRQVEALDDVVVHRLPLTVDALGQRVGRGGLAVVAVLDVPCSKHLRRQLRRLRSLG